VTVIAASSAPNVLFIIVIGFVLIWLVFVRPQKKRQSQQQQMLNELHEGDEVLTAGGIYGTITHVDEDDDRITLEIAPGLEVEVARRAIAGITQEPDEADEGEEADESEEPDEAEESEDSAETEHSEAHEDAAAGPETPDDSTGAISGGEAPVDENRG
jgi:preprotein translocase subunit YajC